MNKITNGALLITSLMLLVSCGGGGSSDSSSGGSGGETQPVARSVTVNLDELSIYRRSNGEQISVDTAGVSNSITFTE